MEAAGSAGKLVTSCKSSHDVMYQKAVVFSCFADRGRLCHDSAKSNECQQSAVKRTVAAYEVPERTESHALTTGAVGGGYL